MMNPLTYKRHISTFLAVIFTFSSLIGSLPIQAQQRASNRPRTTTQDPPPQSTLDRETNLVRIDSPGVQIGYNQRRGATKVEFRRPTDPEFGKLPNGLPNRGSMKIETKGGYTELDVCNNCEKFDLPGPASSIAPGLNTYVLWVITPTGHAENIAEVLFEDHLAGVGSDERYADVSTTQPVFAMMVTAEPHFAVQTPSRHVVLVSRPQKQDENNAGLRVADSISFNPSAAPNNIDPTILSQIPQCTITLDQTTTGKVRHMVNTINQARVAIAMAQTAVDNIRTVREIAQERTIREAEQLIKDPAHKPIYDQMQETLENRLRVPLYEETQARFSLEDARKALDRALLGSQAINPKSTIREPMLPIARDARLATQSAQAAKDYADIASSRIEITRLRIQVDALVRLNDELAAELRRANAHIAELEDQLRRANDRIRELEGRVRDLETQISDLQRQLEEARRRIAELERDNARLRAELDRFCQELKQVVANLGEIVQEGNTVTVRLKSDILFPEAVYLLTVDRDLNKDARPRLAQLALLLQIIYKDARFQFIGHTDTVDESDYNQWLSEQRALEVMRFFYQAQLQIMESNDPQRDEFQRKASQADQLLDNRQFPEWLPQRKRGGLKDNPRAQSERAQLLSQLSEVVQGKGETQLAVQTPDNTSEARNRRVEIQITLPPQSSLPYCNNH